MICGRDICVALAGLVLAATPSLARAEESRNFTVGESAFTYAVPDGFCLPSGPDIAVAEAVAELDKSSLTHANLDRCGSFGEEYIHIKTPRQNEPVTMAKPLFLALIARQLQSTSSKEMLETAIREVEADVSKGMGLENALKVGYPAFGGQDKDCVYMFINLEVQVGAETKRARASGCMTVVGQQFFSVNSYALADSGLSFDTLKQRSRMVAVSLASVAAP